MSFLEGLLVDDATDLKKLEYADPEAETLAVIEQGLKIERLKALYSRYVGATLPRKGNHASPELDFDLGIARNNKEIDNRGGQVIFITECTGTAKFRFDGIAKPLYPVRAGIMNVPFEKLYLTNTAQVGKIITLIIGQDPNVTFIADPVTPQLDKIPKQATTPTYANKNMLLADTEYTTVIPDGTTKVYASTEDGTAFKISLQTNKWIIIPTDRVYFRENVKLTGKTLYFQCAVADKDLFMEFWK